MKTSENGILFLKAREGFLPKIGNDVGHPVIGHGHDLTPAEIASGDFAGGISRVEADVLLRKDLNERFEPIVNHFIPPTCNQNQFDALLAACYNMGEANFATMMHHGFDQVPVQLPAWHWTHVNGVLTDSEGLTTRRTLEVALFNTPC